MKFKFLTLDDVSLANKRVLVRVDINSPIANNSTILETARIKSIIPTLDMLKDSKTVLLAHQSRPGKKDFTSLEPHAEVLKNLVDRPVKFIDDIFGSAARNAIKELKNGEILLLENVRFYSEEVAEDIPPEKQAQTIMVRKLTPLFDLFVNDAFAAAHRAQPSLIGFTYTLPTVAGKVMEKELSALNKVFDPERPAVFIIGGAKVDTKLEILKNILKNGKADKILLGGLLVNVFLEAKGYNIGEVNRKAVDKFEAYIGEAKNILKEYEDKIEVPIDVAIEKNGKRYEVSCEELDKENRILDIGLDTIVKYSNTIVSSKTVVANGPLGLFEKEDFALGTREILDAMTRCKHFTVVGGGELGGYAEILGVSNKIKHLSTGGGATLALLSGEELPVIKALEESAKKFKEKLQ
ncbi:MAG: phosphoglycerate kinase [Candidatus Odinarchaeum yellowstonii]|uniref:Phosphoglycerate kinase n=1 Tax=Odinarchaeota yellowstonii (strain LCB_4) TaxID=1841599 RepID=A0AAF0D3E3_ODILC|nr:MAG: phosphoglycerate kinase [Candidatus Odinarchaeum yellowstonii]